MLLVLTGLCFSGFFFTLIYPDANYLFIFLQDFNQNILLINDCELDLSLLDVDTDCSSSFKISSIFISSINSAGFPATLADIPDSNSNPFLVSNEIQSEYEIQKKEYTDAFHTKYGNNSTVVYDIGDKYSFEVHTVTKPDGDHIMIHGTEHHALNYTFFELFKPLGHNGAQIVQYKHGVYNNCFGLLPTPHNYIPGFNMLDGLTRPDGSPFIFDRDWTPHAKNLYWRAEELNNRSIAEELLLNKYNWVQKEYKTELPSYLESRILKARYLYNRDDILKVFN